ncbi:pentapeptide repeat-containing protein [Peptococcus simiae]|uniref:pentapeptide repeat-containing protein n=1 Tax=Peptococcus simiae TaxID=1643805 RepID=UPI0039816062
MREISWEELQVILDKHVKWLEGSDDRERADLSNVDLRKANLSSANLQGANLQNAELQNANLRNTNLSGADLRNANLSGADLQNANLSGASLRNADLSGADLLDASLLAAYLTGADLSNAKLFNANLSNANLWNANLWRTGLHGANLTGADLSGADLLDVSVNVRTAFYHLQCPEEGSFTAWKKCHANEQPVLVKLLIPEDAKRSSATSRKCRASKAKVLAVTSLDGETHYKEARSGYDSRFVYRPGETIEVDDFEKNRWIECASGIHFFMTKDEAIQY